MTEEQGSEPFLTRWLRQPSLWIGAILTMIGVVTIMLRQPSVQWYMSHSVDEILQQGYLTLMIFAAFAVPAMAFWCYSLYLSLKK
jgi:NADH:ubiquinone oxidoreductase subunit K